MTDLTKRKLWFVVYAALVIVILCVILWEVENGQKEYANKCRAAGGTVFRNNGEQMCLAPSAFIRIQ